MVLLDTHFVAATHFSARVTDNCLSVCHDSATPPQPNVRGHRASASVGCTSSALSVPLNVTEVYCHDSATAKANPDDMPKLDIPCPCCEGRISYVGTSAFERPAGIDASLLCGECVEVAPAKDLPPFAWPATCAATTSSPTAP